MKNKIILGIIFLLTYTWVYASNSWYKPKIGDNMLIQLQWNINMDYNVDIFDIDLYDTNVSFINKLHNDWKKVICYFSAWTYEDWRNDAKDFPKDSLWKDLDNWPWEKWLDIGNYQLFSNVMIKRLDLAKSKWCDWVDPDNVDWYTNDTWFNISFKKQIEYNKFLVNESHKRWLSIWLKNALLQINELVDYYDFAINESCYTYNECNYLKSFIKLWKPVFWIQYKEKKKDFCNRAINSKYSFVKDNSKLDWSWTSFCNIVGKYNLKSQNYINKKIKDKYSNIKWTTIKLNEKMREKIDELFIKIDKKLNKDKKKELFIKLNSRLDYLEKDNRYKTNIQYRLLIDYVRNKIKD